jgi:hypothetical protein
MLLVQTTDILPQAWRNTTGEVSKVLFVLVPSVPIKHPKTGEVLAPTDAGHLETEEGANAAIEKLGLQQ